MADIEKINNIATGSIENVNGMTIGGASSGSGGTETTVGAYSVHTFTSTGTFTWTSGSGDIEKINNVAPVSGTNAVDVMCMGLQMNDIVSYTKQRPDFHTWE